MIVDCIERRENAPFNGEMHEPPPAGNFIQLHNVCWYPAVLAVFDGAPKVMEQSKEVKVPFHLPWGNERSGNALCSNDVGGSGAVQVTRPRTSHMNEGGKPNEESGSEEE